MEGADRAGTEQVDLDLGKINLMLDHHRDILARFDPPPRDLAGTDYVASAIAEWGGLTYERVQHIGANDRSSWKALSALHLEFHSTIPEPHVSV